jgi:hypothetical protein
VNNQLSREYAVNSVAISHAIAHASVAVLQTREVSSLQARLDQNHEIQGTNATISKISMSILWKILPKYKAKLVKFVHDELVVSCPKQHAEQVAKEIGEAFKKAATIIRKEVLFLFSIVIIFLLLSLTKFNNFTNNIQLRDLRIQNQIHFNFAVFYNFIICCLFLIFLFKNYGIFKIKLSSPFDFSHITKLFHL